MCVCVCVWVCMCVCVCHHPTADGIIVVSALKRCMHFNEQTKNVYTKLVCMCVCVCVCVCIVLELAAGWEIYFNTFLHPARDNHTHTHTHITDT